MSKNTALDDSLIRFLRGTTVSWAIVQVLAKAGQPLTFEGMSEALKRHLSGRIPVPSLEGAARVCTSLLTESGWVTESDEGIEVTDLGRELFERVEG